MIHQKLAFYVKYLLLEKLLGHYFLLLIRFSGTIFIDAICATFLKKGNGNAFLIDALATYLLLLIISPFQKEYTKFIRNDYHVDT